MSGRSARAAMLMVIALALIAYAATRLRVSADFSAFLPAGATATQRALIQQLREGAAGRLLLIDLSDAPAAQLARASRALAARLSSQSLFRYVANGDAARARRDLDVVARHRYVLSPRVEPGRFGVEGLHDALAARLEGLYGSAAPIEKEWLAQDPTAEVRAALQRIVPASSPRSVDGVWFDASGRHALLVAETTAAASDLDGQARALAALEAAHAEAAAGTALVFSSPGALAVESRARIAREARLLSIVSAVLIVIVLAFTYRGVRPVLLCALPAAVGLLAGVCAVHAALGHLNGITLAFGATLLGEAVDYPSFLFTQVERDETPSAARRRVGPLLRLAVLTTACGSLALLASGFSGLVELGVMTLVGILTAGAVTWWIVADWIPQDMGRALPALRAVPHARVPLSRPVRAWIVAVVLAVVALVDGRRPLFDDDLAHLNPLPPTYAQRDRALRAALGAPDVRSLILVRGTSEEDLLERMERLGPLLAQAVAAGEAQGYDLVSDVLPSAATQARRRAALPSPEVLHANLATAIVGTPFRVDAFAPFERDVQAARAAPPLTARDLAGTALGLRVSSLLGRDGDGPYAVVPLRGLHDEPALAARVKAVDDPNVAWLDLRAESVELLAAYRHRAMLSTALGIVLIGVVLALGLRDVRRALRVLAPIVAATLLAAGALVAAGVALTIFHLVALLLVIGIGVNYALFAERAVKAPGELPRVVRTVTVVSATTLCAFATLAFSEIPVLHALGLTVCSGVIACVMLVAFFALSTTRAATVGARS
jgi:predicted exporter